ncbi:MAG: phosphotransferase family protein, partial [Candidatus Nanopelagicales bacterium]|nr:phosphotransferase family protein [Candidatus Nanopelagicales bacterium]
MADTATHPFTPAELERLTRWMDSVDRPGTGETPELTKISGGSQNELYLVDRGGDRTVMRIPPRSMGAARADGVLREMRILGALKGTDVPHGELVVGCEDSEVLGIPFYLMKQIHGWSMAGGGWPEPYASDLSLRPSLGYALVEGAAKLAAVDWKAQGLEGFGRPDNFHDRQVGRWTSFLDGYKFRDIPGLDETTAWLDQNKPRAWEPGIMHGDYQFANIMFTNDVPAGLAAVVDWEMTTIGDPLLDLAWALRDWGPVGDADDSNIRGTTEGQASLEDLLAHYEKLSGRSTQDFNYYLVLARWKLAIVLEMSYARVVKENLDNPSLAGFGPLVLELMSQAAGLARTMPNGLG